MLGFGKKKIVETGLIAEPSLLRRQVQTIERVSTLLISGTPIDTLLGETADAISDIAGVSLVAILLWDKQSNKLKLSKTSIPRAAEVFVESVTGKKIKEIIYPTSDPNNLFSKAIEDRQIEYSSDVQNALVPLMSKTEAGILVGIVRNQISLLVVVPMVVNNEVYGVIALGWKQTTLPDTEKAILTTFANQAAIAIVNSGYVTQIKTQVDELNSRNKRLESINKFTDTIITTLDPARVVQDALDNIPKLFGYLSAVYSIYDRKSNTIRIGGLSQNEISKNAFRILGIKPSEIVSDLNDPKFANGIAAQAIKENTIKFTDNFSEYVSNIVNDTIANQIQKLVGFKSVAIIPIKLKNEVVGVISFLFSNMSSEEVKAKELDTLIIITNQLTIALENASLYVQVGRALEQLKLSNNQLQEKYQFEKDMMGIMGHELRTPMTIARGMAELLRTKAVQPQEVDKTYLKEKVDKIHDSIIKESDLIQTLLSASHIDNDKLNFSITTFNFPDLVEFAVMTFKNDAKAKGLELIFEKPKDISPMTSDQSRIQEIVSNLISNAIKYTNEGSITVTVDQQDGFVYYRVKDTGIGIPKEEIPNIGKKFYRVGQHLDNNVNIVRAGGTGLGLYVVKGILDAIGGGLQIDSEVGKGSTFTALLPLVSKVAQEQGFTTQKPVEKGDMFQELGMKKTEGQQPMAQTQPAEQPTPIQPQPTKQQPLSQTAVTQS